MKKLLKFLFLTTLIIFSMSMVTVFAQDPGGGEPIVFPDLNTMFTTFAAFSAAVIVLTGILTRAVTLEGIGRSITSWVIALLAGLIGYWLKLGIFAEVDLLGAAMIVVSAALGSNMLYNVDWIRLLLTKLKIAKAPKTMELRR